MRKNGQKMMETGRRLTRKKAVITLTLLLAAAAGALAFFAVRFRLLPAKSYTASALGIPTIRSSVDKDGDGVDDYMDLMRGARAYVQTRPVYKDGYYAGGYPPEGEGVCTDVIWHAFRSAGYSLKDLVDEDIASHRDAYPGITKQDKNIDFRRVRNLKIFFSRHAVSLTTDINDVAQWQPGDIVVFSRHIAVISDKRNRKGIPFIIHNAGRPYYEEDAITLYPIVGHYRWAPKGGA